MTGGARGENEGRMLAAASAIPVRGMAREWQSTVLVYPADPITVFKHVRGDEFDTR